MNRYPCVDVKGDQQFWSLVELWVDSCFYPVTRSGGDQKFWILLKLWADSFFVPCRDGGSEILNPCGIMNRLPFCSVKLWAGGSEIPNLSNKESAIGARSLLHEIVQFDGIGKLDAMFLVDSSEHFFFSFSLAKTFGRHKLFQHQIPILSKFSQIRKPHFSLEGVITLRVI